MEFARRYDALAGWIVSQCPYPDKFAHTYAGLAIWLAAAIIARRGLGSLIPLLAVIAAEVGNECVDRVAHGSWMWADTLGDMAATWFWPCLLMLAIRTSLVPMSSRLQ